MWVLLLTPALFMPGLYFLDDTTSNALFGYCLTMLVFFNPVYAHFSIPLWLRGASIVGLVAFAVGLHRMTSIEVDAPMLMLGCVLYALNEHGAIKCGLLKKASRAS